MSRKTIFAGSIIIFAVLVLAVILIVGTAGEKEPSIIYRPWVNTPYRDLPDSVLLGKAQQHDTLAAMVLGWHYMDDGDSTAAASFLTGFNPGPETASSDLNYLSAMALMGTERDTSAIRYLIPIMDNKAYPNARIYLAELYKKLKNYEQALAVYEKLDAKYLEGLDDSILVCKGEMGDSASAMQFALKMLEEGKAIKGVRFFSKYVSLSRGVSPPLWSYGAGKAYLQGNNPTRAAAYLENADADTSFADLSYNLGLAYYRLEVFDSSASKMTQAMEMGDTSKNLLSTLIGSYRMGGYPEKAFEASMFAIKAYPDFEEFYIIPTKTYYDSGQYDRLLDFTREARKYVKDSYKIDSYYAAANYLVGDTATAIAFIDTLIMKHRFEAGALKEASRLFETSLGLTDIAQRLKENDPAIIFPETAGFLQFYHRDKSRGMIDSCRVMLETWIKNDTVTARRQLMVELYNRDFPDSTQN